MNKKLLNIVAILCIFLVCQGCTCRAWYDGLKEVQRLDCQKLPGARERQECLDRANSITYDQYSSEREKREKSNP
jgi:hypothetical protein